MSSHSLRQVMEWIDGVKLTDTHAIRGLGGALEILWDIPTESTSGYQWYGDPPVMTNIIGIEHGHRIHRNTVASLPIRNAGSFQFVFCKRRNQRVTPVLTPQMNHIEIRSVDGCEIREFHQLMVMVFTMNI